MEIVLAVLLLLGLVVGQLLWLALLAIGTAFSIHEAGHAIAAKYFGRKVELILNRQGVAIQHDGPDLSLMQQAVITAAGPMANFVLAIALRAFDANLLATLQLLCGLANLLIPQAQSDGTRLVRYGVQAWRERYNQL